MTALARTTLTRTVLGASTVTAANGDTARAAATATPNPTAAAIAVSALYPRCRPSQPCPGAHRMATVKATTALATTTLRHAMVAVAPPAEHGGTTGASSRTWGHPLTSTTPATAAAETLVAAKRGVHHVGRHSPVAHAGAGVGTSILVATTAAPALVRTAPARTTRRTSTWPMTWPLLTASTTHTTLTAVPVTAPPTLRQTQRAPAAAPAAPAVTAAATLDVAAVVAARAPARAPALALALAVEARPVTAAAAAAAGFGGTAAPKPCGATATVRAAPARRDDAPCSALSLRGRQCRGWSALRRWRWSKRRRATACRGVMAVPACQGAAVGPWSRRSRCTSEWGSTAR